MTWISGTVVYVLSWWIVLFCVLPLGIRPAREGHLGHDAGAPANPWIGRRLLLTSLIAGIVTGAVYLFIRSGWINLRGGA
jgi:predicted secreted protein